MGRVSVVNDHGYQLLSRGQFPLSDLYADLDLASGFPASVDAVEDRRYVE